MIARALRILAAVAFVAFGTASPANSAVVYTNFGSIPPGYQASDGFGLAIVGADNSFGYVQQGSRFSPTSGGYLSSVSLALLSIDGPNYIALDLFSDVSGQVGAVLATSDLTDQLRLFPNSPSVVQFLFTGDLFLQAGVNYWLMSRTIEDALVSWQWATSSIFAPAAYRTTVDGSWTYVSQEVQQITRNHPGAFLVETRAIPEPSVLTLLLLSAALLISFHRVTAHTRR